MIVNYDRNCSFMVLDTVITIVNYDRHMFIVQATSVKIIRNFVPQNNDSSVK